MKRHPEDFPLWKVAEPGREMAWDSPWGRGYPGWHIECSAMSIKYLGPHFDLHTGGVDNIFPHHEDEIAQSEAYTGQRFVNYWVHAQHLLSDGLKMAKSTGNAYTLADVTARGFEPMALRYFYTTAHYRSRINFTFSALRAAETGLARLRLALLELARATDSLRPRSDDHRPRPDGNATPRRVPRNAAGGTSLPSAVEEDAVPMQPLAPGHTLEPYRDAFLAAVEDDLNIPRALAVVWSLLRGEGAGLPVGERLALILDLDRILGLDLAGWLERQQGTATIGLAPAELPRAVASAVTTREMARHEGEYARADALRREVTEQGYTIRDTREGPIVVARRPEEGLMVISRSGDAPNHLDERDSYQFSINLLAHNSRDDLERCITGILRHRDGRGMELVIVDNGSTDDTLEYLRHVARAGLTDANGHRVDARVLFADHDMGFAAGRNATMQASRGHIVVLMDTSIEVIGDIWTPLTQALADPTVGVTGPYALVTEDLKEFEETDGPKADAVEGYLMAFRRAQLTEVGPAEEKFRFYRLLDIYMSFMFKTSGYSVTRVPEVAERVVKHAHREWYSLTEEERATRSKRNFDVFRRRWHHGQSLLVANYVPEHRYFGHDHRHHIGGTHGHAPHELPPPGRPHTHIHRHWPDHSHEHPHYHDREPALSGASGQRTRAGETA
jgi:cysteinyl-tRNA synthetase